MRIAYSYQGTERALDFEATQVVIGRPKPGVKIDLDLTPDKAVSRPHARIWMEDGHCWIEDLNSTGGTRICGEEVKGKGKRKLKAGDMIEIGETTLHVDIGAEAGELDRTMPPALVAAQPAGKIAEVVDANVSPFTRAVAPTRDTAQRLGLLYELIVQSGTKTSLDGLLQTILGELVKVIPGAAYGALLVKDSASGELLLKAHFPPGQPAVSLTLARRAMEQRQGFLWQRSEDMTMSMLWSQQEHQIGSVMYAPLLCDGEALGAMCLGNYETCPAFESDDLRLLVAVAHHGGMAIAHHQLNEDLRRNAILLTRLLTNFSPKIREKLLAKTRHGKLRLGGEKSEVTILCSDIRGFTRKTATMEAEDVVDMLNYYFSALVESIFKYDGTIDKFVGDSILAVFGSPEPDPQQHEKAVRAALAMQEDMKQLNTVRAATGQVVCEIGIGIHCGEVLHGFIGSDERMEFTVIGDAVNRTARYCDGSGSSEVLISPEVYQRVWKIVRTEPTTIPTKHEGNFPAFRIKSLKP